MITVVDLTSSGLTTATTAYTSGDMLGVQMTLTIPGTRGVKVAAGEIMGATIIDDSAVIGAVDLFFFDQSTTPAADNAANAWSDADMRNLVGVLSPATVITSANNKVVTCANAETEIPFYAPAGKLYVCAVTRTGNAVFAGGATSLKYRIFMDLC